MNRTHVFHDNIAPTRVRGVDVSTSILRLEDGRDLAFSQFGDLSSPRVLLYCHGGGSCRFEAALGHRTALAQGVRIVAADRPGYGRSSAYPARTFTTAADDLTQLLDALNIDGYVVAGFSAGAPHALATLLRDPSRAKAAVLVNSAGDRQHPLWKRQPVVVRFMFWLMSHQAVWTFGWKQAARQVSAKAARGDDDAAFLLALLQEGCRQGMQAFDADAALCYRQSWNLDWKRASRPVLALHGRRDPNLPFFRALAQNVNEFDLETIPGGHMDALTAETWSRLCLATSRHCGAPAGSGDDTSTPRS